MVLFSAFFAESSMFRGDYSGGGGKKARRVAFGLFRTRYSILYDNSYWGERFARRKRFQEKREAVFRPELRKARSKSFTCCLGNRAGRSSALRSQDQKAPEPANGTQACRVRRMASGESDIQVK
jgi:hypothetical protein